MTDYKQLCAELVDAIDSGIPTDRMHLSPLMLRARAALAEPEPSINRPDRLRVGDVWEFWTELHVNGKQKKPSINYYSGRSKGGTTGSMRGSYKALTENTGLI